MDRSLNCTFAPIFVEIDNINDLESIALLERLAPLFVDEMNIEVEKLMLLDKHNYTPIIYFCYARNKNWRDTNFIGCLAVHGRLI